MRILGLPIGTVVILALVVIGAIALKEFGATRRGGGSGRYRAKRLLTENEFEFYGRLRTALPDHEILAQVAMGALLEPDGAYSRLDYQRLRGPIAQKIVDFVICERLGLKPVAVVELDDRTHDKRKDAERDQILNAAGYRVLRWDSRSKPTPVEIAAAVAGVETATPR